MSIPMQFFEEIPHPVAELDDTASKQHYLSIVALIKKRYEVNYLMQMLMLELLARDIRLSEEHVKQAAKTAMNNNKMAEALTSWNKHPLRDMLLYDMCYIAAVDGSICDQDREYLQTLAEQLYIPKKKCDALIQIALTLRFSKGDHDLAWFYKTLAQGGLDAEQFAFVRRRF